MLERAGMTRAVDIPKYKPIRFRWLGENKPAFLLGVIPGLVREEFLVEIEAIAVAPPLP